MSVLSYRTWIGISSLIVFSNVSSGFTRTGMFDLSSGNLILNGISEPTANGTCFIVFEIVAQAYLVATLYSLKKQLSEYINENILKLKF